MYPGGPNPTHVQTAPRGTAGLPLVLIHDGGGTTFSYFLLGDLGRDVWAIHNPKFFDGLAWEGGVDEMVAAYLSYLGMAGLKGPVVLGGWSLGGFVSVAMAHCVAKDPEAYAFKVVGLVLIDSPYHIARSRVEQPYSRPRMTGLPPLVGVSFSNCDVMLQDWDLPRWHGGEGGEMALTVEGEALTLSPAEVLYRSAEGGDGWTKMQVRRWDDRGGEADEVKLSPPPAVLLRCTEYAPRAQVDGSDRDAPPCLVDLDRQEKLLGWEGQYVGFIRAVVDVPTHHYDIFDRTVDSRIDDVTSKLVQGLGVLDAIHGPTTSQVPEIFF